MSGQVTLDGAPIPDGQILFRPQPGVRGPTASAPIENGAYSIPAEHGPTAGTYAVVITADRPTGRQVQSEMIGSETTAQYEQYVPAQYNDRTSLTAEVAATREDLDFKLTSQQSR